MALMAAVKQIDEVLHRIRIKLYPSYLPNTKGAYLARTNNEAELGIEQVCAAMKNRGGFAGNYALLVDSVQQFFDEAAYQLCDGYSVNMRYFSVNPNIGGTFDSPWEAHDHTKNPVCFRFRVRQKLKRLASHIAVEVEGLADTADYISAFTDVATGTVNETVTSGEPFVITGSKIKVAGDDASCGVYLQPTGDPNAMLKIDARFVHNSGRKIIGVAPALLEYDAYRVVIVTQYANAGNTLLKQAKTISSNFELIAA